MNDFIAMEASYEEGYDAGKQAAAEQIFADLEEASICSRGGIVLNPWDIAKLKEKYGVQ